MPGAGELARALDEWAGDREGVTFTPDAVQAIWRWSGGLPRLVNLLCDRALEAAYAQQLHRVDGALVEAAAIALDLRTPSAPVATALEARAAEAGAPDTIAPEDTAPKDSAPEDTAPKVCRAANPSRRSLSRWRPSRQRLLRHRDGAPTIVTSTLTFPSPQRQAPSSEPQAPSSSWSRISRSWKRRRPRRRRASTA